VHKYKEAVYDHGRRILGGWSKYWVV